MGKFHRVFMQLLWIAGTMFSLLVPMQGQTMPVPEESVSDKVYLQGIRTVILRNLSWEFSLPVIELHSQQQLELLFDDLSDRARYFDYTLIHCNSEWKPSDLPWQQYLQGFNKGEIRDVNRSFGTTYDYVNYRLVFPEEQMMPVVSGNYALVVYEKDRPDQIVLTRRFYVLERQVEIKGQVNLSPGGGLEEGGQQINFYVLDPANLIRNAGTELDAVVVQNGRPDQAVHAQKPRFISMGRIDYDFSDLFIFQAGNEFRGFDTRSMKYQSERIASIEFRNPYYHVFLKPDESREFSPYFFREDMNGSFFIDRENAGLKHQEADYVYVHFKLDPASLPGDEQVYVFGMLTDWELNETNKMTYSPEGYYELILLLKQGLYDYIYVTKTAGKDVDEEMFEGNHYETENTYSIFAYFHNMREGLDQLIGFISMKAP